MLGTIFRVTNSKVNVIDVRIIIVKRLTIGNLFNIVIRTTITLTFELVTLNIVPNIYILGKSKHIIELKKNIFAVRSESRHPGRVRYVRVGAFHGGTARTGSNGGHLHCGEAYQDLS